MLQTKKNKKRQLFSSNSCVLRACVTLKLSNRMMKQLRSEQEEDMESMHHQEETVMRGIKPISQKQQENYITVRRKKLHILWLIKWVNNTVLASFQQLSGVSTAHT